MGKNRKRRGRKPSPAKGKKRREPRLAEEQAAQTQQAARPNKAEEEPKKTDAKSNGTLNSETDLRLMQFPEDDKFDLKVVWRVFRVFGRHYKPYIKTLIFAFSCLFGTVAVGAVSSWPLKLIIDQVILQEALPEGFTFLAPLLTIEASTLLLILAISIVVLKLIEAIVSFLNKYLVSATGDRMQADIRDRVFAHLQRLSLSFHESIRSGNMIFLMTADVDKMKTILVNLPQDFLHRTLTIIISITFMAILDWRLCLMGLAAVPFIYLTTVLLGKSMRNAMRKRRMQEGQVASVVAENATSMALVKAYGREKTEMGRFNRENRESLEAQVRFLKVGRAFSRTIDIFTIASMTAILYFGGKYALGHAITPGVLVLMTVYLKEIHGAVEKLSVFFFDLIAAQASAERLLGLAENDMILEDRPDAADIEQVKGKIEFKNVSFSYDKKTPVLDNVSFTINAGETIALMGPSGAGKSTLISLLMRFYDPDEGEIYLDGRDIREFTIKSLRDQMTILMQDAKLFQQSVRENIAFGKAGATEEEVIAAAKKAEADEFILKMKNGYKTFMFEGGENLSGGQKQRINIARAIIRDTPLVILDEPATGVDAFTEERINAALEHLTEKKTAFVIAHKFATVAGADKILFLKDSAVAGFGTHDKLLKSNPDYLELFEAQFEWQKSLENGQTVVNGKTTDSTMETV